MTDRRTHPALQPRATRWLAEILAGAIALITVLAASAEAAPLDHAMDTLFSVHTADDADAFLGSAFLWGESGEVAVTNAHVVKDATEVRLRDAHGTEEIATVIATDPTRDVAVLSVKSGRRGLTAATAPALGAQVWALGAPLGIEFTVTQGTISALSRQTDPAAPILMLQHDAAVNPGSSGGPLVDAAGALIGMNSQIADGSRMFVGIAYAIPAGTLAQIVQGLIEETLPPLPQLGLRARPVDRQLAEVLGIPPTGLLVDEVEAASHADRAGIRPGDILLTVADRALSQPGDLPFAIEAAQAQGETVDIALMRGRDMLLLSLPLTVAEADSLTLRDIGPATPARVQSYTLETLGITLNDQARITAVSDHSPAAQAGIAPGDRVLMLNGIELAPDALRSTTIDGAALFLVEGPGGTRHVLVDPYGKSGGIRPVGGANVLDPDVVVF